MSEGPRPRKRRALRLKRFEPRLPGWRKTVIDKVAEYSSKRIIRYLEKEVEGYTPFFAPHPTILADTLQPGDILLVEGNNRVSGIIKHLTQSTWSHAALYIGDALDPLDGPAPRVLLEALPEEGVLAVPLAKYARFNTRICRPVGLSPAELDEVIAFGLEWMGRKYDLRYILDLVRYLMPYPPVPTAMRRRLLAIGSADPTRAICSTMIAQAFASVGYPILPDNELHTMTRREPYGVSPYVENEALHIRREGLFTPRDFDISPYFRVVKPTLERGFDFHRLHWAQARQAIAAGMALDTVVARDEDLGNLADPAENADA
jgi:hypothetical protein